MRDGGLRKEYRTHLPQFHWTSIESPFTVVGIPDSNFCHLGKEGWIENKRIRRSDVIEIHPEQVAWHERHVRAGGKVFIGVRWRKFDDSFYLLQAAAGRWLLTHGLHLRDLPAQYRLGAWHGGPARWNWPKIADILLSA